MESERGKGKEEEGAVQKAKKEGPTSQWGE